MLARNGGQPVGMDEILDPKEVAKLLKVNPRTVVRWAEQRKLPGFKLGDLWRFRREAIEEHIRQLEKGTITFTNTSPQDEKAPLEGGSDTSPSDNHNQDTAEKS
jgi:excisionase family DNA binding protein